uniref:NADH-ubiquinone oxidoreductase chain 5 n=2 Tax=Arctica islandica TaxID=59239 RepID=T1QRC0_ARCIS|nr:NADH dehydrogenase subunit 5 [Arctica islandica]AGC84098.1 NADH dehydrogenase subunit 5 [Arctica islandica]AGW53596.1 NADH dehydrogenase subunit 5 [Arctica islandica]AGW53608.1 NADH dehydrogenase subunit 5 [Arctica islandica]
MCSPSVFWLGKKTIIFSSFFSLFFLSLVLFSFKSLISSLSTMLVFEIEILHKTLLIMSFPLIIDSSSLLLGSVVLFISSFVMIFCGFYMSHEVFLVRFILTVVWFVISMSLLVFFPSFFALMIGWDWLGVVSFLLVIYYMNKESLSAGMITAITNRLGDVFFILVIGFLSLNLSYEYFSISFFGQVFVVVGLVLVGSMTKSAQIPFSAWLPAAMAAPTPVSTLVHSSTLVTAGVYVLFRFSCLFSSGYLFLLLFFSSMTLVMAGMSAVGEVDMKKVIALSTLSQLGVMMLCLALGLKMIALFHLVVHAFFKALMFMCVGSVIFLSGGVQDGRFLSGLWLKLPSVCSWLVVCNLSLAGLPFMSGFYSKDLIMEAGVEGSLSGVGMIFLFSSIFLTAVYSMRMILLLLSWNEKTPNQGYSEKDMFLKFSIFGLGFGAIWGGFFMQLGMSSFSSFVFVSSFMKSSIFIMVMLGGLSSILVLYNFMNLKEMMPEVKGFLSKMWFMPYLSGNFFSSKFLFLASQIMSLLEKGWMESFIWGSGLKNLSISWGGFMREAQMKALGIVFFVCLIMWIFMILA